MSDLFNFDVDNFSFEFPKPDDRLFISCEDWHHNACVSTHKIYAYIHGYKAAADALCDEAIERRGTLDTLIFPICNLYRHYLELHLKDIINWGRAVGGKGKNNRYSHSLEALWSEAEPTILLSWPDFPKSDTVNLGRIIKEFHETDKSAQEFRYNKKTDGTMSLFNTTHINVRNLKEVMERVGNLLDSASEGLSQQWEMICEQDKY